MDCPCFLYNKGRWGVGEWYHRDAYYKYLTDKSTLPHEMVKLISIPRPGREPFTAYFSSDEDRVFFIEKDAENTDDIVFLSLTLPII
jgi:hypothetical protein